MLKWPLFTLLHIIPLFLAATNFSLFHPTTWTCTFYEMTYANGWGYVYHSDYTLSQVLTYLLAYASGIVLYPLVTRPRFLGIAAAVVCAAGFVSFAIEFTHWLFDHHLSLILSVPALLWLITLWTFLSAALRRPMARPVAG